MIVNKFNKHAALYFIGILLLVWGIMCLLPVTISFINKESDFLILLFNSLGCIFIGIILSFIFRFCNKQLSKKDSQTIVGFMWLIIPLFGSLPYLFIIKNISIIDAIFESFSGFTTTGSTIITDLDTIGQGLLCYRSLTQWFGGLGFAVIIISILRNIPNLFEAEFVQVTSNKLFPQLSDTIRGILLVYCSLTVLCFVFLSLGDMNLITALCHAFSTVSTGGFSTSNGNIGAFSLYSKLVIMAFMFVSGISYYLIVNLVRCKFKMVFSNEQLKYYILLIIVVSLCFVIYWSKQSDYLFTDKIYNALFYSISIISSTGYDLHFSQLGTFVSTCLLILMLIGGCSASSSTGLKIIRVIILGRYARSTLKKIFHSHAVIPVKYNKKSLQESEVRNIFGFFFLYFIIFIIGIFILTCFGNELSSSMYISASNLGNIGPVASDFVKGFHYYDLNVGSKITLIILMLIGRLEIFSFFALFSKSLWLHK